MVQAISRRPLTAEARVPSRVYMGFVVDKVTLGQDFPRLFRFSPVSFIPQVFHYTEKRKKNSQLHHRVAH
jgi:hypothetical protein